MRHFLFCCGVLIVCTTILSPAFTRNGISISSTIDQQEGEISNNTHNVIPLPFKDADRAKIEKIAKTDKEFSRIERKPLHEMYFVIRKTIETYRYDIQSNTWSVKKEIKTSIDWFELIFHVFGPIFVVVVSMLVVQSVGYLFIRLIFGFKKIGLIVLMRKYQFFLFSLLFLMTFIIMHYGELEQSLSSTKFLFQQSILIVSGFIGYVLYVRFIQKNYIKISR